MPSTIYPQIVPVFQMSESHHVIHGTHYWLVGSQWWVEYQMTHGAIYPPEYEQAWANTADYSKLEWTRGTNGGGKAWLPDGVYRVKCNPPR